MAISDIDLKLIPNLLGISEFITVGYKSWDRNREESDFPQWRMYWDVYGPEMRDLTNQGINRMLLSTETWNFRIGHHKDIRLTLLEEELKFID
jgi:hypothetical protein